MKVKVIDLLNKIANGEEIPKKIKYDGHIFEYEKDIEYICIDTDYLYNQVHINQSIGEIYRIDLILNNEVEIIEDTPKEDKKIEKLEQKNDTGLIGTDSVDMIEHTNRINRQAWYLSEIVSKINEIIDKVNGEDNE